MSAVQQKTGAWRRCCWLGGPETPDNAARGPGVQRPGATGYTRDRGQRPDADAARLRVVAAHERCTGRRSGGLLPLAARDHSVRSCAVAPPLLSAPGHRGDGAGDIADLAPGAPDL